MSMLFGKRTRSTRGFTLVELLVAALIGAILLAATAGIVVNVLRIDREESGRSEVQAELTQAVEFMQRELSEATYIYGDEDDNDIPDVIELLYDPGWIKRPPNSIPVVAFWKYEPLPDSCFQGDDPATGLLRPKPNAIPQEYWDGLRSRRSVFNLVVYYHRVNYNTIGNPNDPAEWEGNSRITRYALQPLGAPQASVDPAIPIDNRCATVQPFFNHDPEEGNFLDWPDDTFGQIPAQPNDDSDPVVLTSNIYSSRPNQVVAAPACETGYDLGGGRPTSLSAPGFGGLGVNQSDDAFYICVRNNPGELANLPQDVFINLIGTSLQRANSGVFRRYISDVNSVSLQNISGYLHAYETRVLSRGVIGRGSD